MRKLDECLMLTREIKEIDEKIMELQTVALSPRGQIITGMPKCAGGTSSGYDTYLESIEQLEKKRSRKMKKRESIWGEVTELLQKTNIKHENVQLMQYRFCKGLQWKQCCAIMCRTYPEQNWNMNKVFRVYRKVIRITR